MPRHARFAVARILAVAALTVLSMSCAEGPLEPILPSWDVNVTMPLMNRLYAAGEMLPILPPPGTPMKSFVVCDTAVIGDTTGDGTPDRSPDSATLQDVNGGKLYVEVTNGLPAQILLKAGLLAPTGTLLLPLPKGAADSIRVAPAETLDGRVTRPSVVTSVLDLAGSDVRLMIPADRVRYAMVFEFPGGTIPGLTGAETLRVRMWTTVSYRVNQ